MTRRSLRILVFVGLCIPAQGAAQSAASATLTVESSVIRSLALTKLSTGNLTFGFAAQGTTDRTNYRAAGATQYKAMGQVQTVVDVSFGDAALTRSGYSLTFTPIVAGHTTNSKNSAAELAAGADVTLSATTGEYYLWVGGDLIVPLGAPPGLYTGMWTLTLAYTST